MQRGHTGTDIFIMNSNISQLVCLHCISQQIQDVESQLIHSRLHSCIQTQHVLISLCYPIIPFSVQKTGHTADWQQLNNISLNFSHILGLCVVVYTYKWIWHIVFLCKVYHNFHKIFSHRAHWLSYTLWTSNTQQ